MNFMWDLLKIFDKTMGGEQNSILLHFSMNFFLFQSLDIRALENLSACQIFQLDLL